MLLTKDELEKEIKYQLSMHILREMIKQKLIDDTEYQILSSKLRLIYEPLIGSLIGDYKEIH